MWITKDEYEEAGQCIVHRKCFQKNSIQFLAFIQLPLDFLYQQRLGKILGLLAHQFFLRTFLLQKSPFILNSGRNVWCEGSKCRTKMTRGKSSSCLLWLFHAGCFVP